jgi:hypothetical protein
LNLTVHNLAGISRVTDNEMGAVVEDEELMFALVVPITDTVCGHKLILLGI